MDTAELVTFLHTTSLRRGWLEDAVRERFGLSMARAWQTAYQAAEDPAVEAVAPAAVHWLRRRREQARRARASIAIP